MKHMITEETMNTQFEFNVNTETADKQFELPKDPFDESLEEQLVLNDTYFAAARSSITVDGMDFSFMKPPYMNFDDHIRTKGKLQEAYRQREFLLLYGYSGCGKTTVLKQFHEKFPDYVHYIPNFTSLSPAQMLVKMGACIGLSLKQRISEITVLEERIASMNGIMYLFDEVSLDYPDAIKKLEKLRDIYMATGVPICICGIPRLYKMLYDSRNQDRYCSVTTRLDEHEMKGMRREDAGNYLNMVAAAENLKFTYIAQQALIRIALSINMGGIHAFTTIIGRCITVARVKYYTAPGRSFPDHTQCIRTAIPEGKAYPGAELILTPPVTPEPILIDEGLVEGLLGEYKSHFPKATVSREE